MRRAVSLVGFVVALVAAALIAPAGAQSSDVRNDVQIGLELLTYVPSGDDQTCLLRTADDIANDPLIAPFASRVRGFLSCSADDGVVSLSVLGLDAGDAVNSLYDAYTPNGFAGGASGCDTEGTWGDGEGRLKCYSTGGGSVVVWTLDADNLVFAAFRADDDVDALYEWWRHDAPPIDDPPAATKPLTDAQWRANGLLLARSVPKALRGSCRLPAIGTDSARTLVSQSPATPGGVDLRPRRWCHRSAVRQPRVASGDAGVRGCVRAGRGRGGTAGAVRRCRLRGRGNVVTARRSGRWRPPLLVRRVRHRDHVVDRQQPGCRRRSRAQRRRRRGAHRLLPGRRRPSCQPGARETDRLIYPNGSSELATTHIEKYCADAP